MPCAASQSGAVRRRIVASITPAIGMWCRVGRRSHGWFDPDAGSFSICGTSGAAWRQLRARPAVSTGRQLRGPNRLPRVRRPGVLESECPCAIAVWSACVLRSFFVRMAWERWRSEGGGLYRHVWLLERAPLPIASDGVHADPRLARVARAYPGQRRAEQHRRCRGAGAAGDRGYRGRRRRPACAPASRLGWLFRSRAVSTARAAICARFGQAALHRVQAGGGGGVAAAATRHEQDTTDVCIGTGTVGRQAHARMPVARRTSISPLQEPP